LGLVPAESQLAIKVVLVVFNLFPVEIELKSGLSFIVYNITANKTYKNLCIVHITMGLILHLKARLV
jgi:hypothetical protein